MSDAEQLIAEVEASNPQATRLAEIVSLAARIEPELLRRARITLVPDANAGTEADLWFSDLVEVRSPVGIVLFGTVAEMLRGRLRQDSNRLDAAWKVVEDVHRSLSPALRAEERLTWLALAGRQKEMRELLRSTLATMLSPTRRGLTSWAARAVPRLPEAARDTEEAQMLTVGAGLRLGNLEGVTEGTLGDSLPEWLKWLSPSDIPTVAFGVRLLDGAIEFGAPGLAQSHRIDLPATRPVLVEFSWQEQNGRRSERITLVPGRGEVRAIGADAVDLRTVTGQRYQIKRVARATRQPRVQLTYLVEVSGGNEQRELPFVIGVLADLSGQPAEPLPRLRDRKFVAIDRENFDAVLASAKPRVACRVANTLANRDEDLAIDLRFTGLDDFAPANVARQVEPLQELLERRQGLVGLLAKTDGNDRLEEGLRDLVGSRLVSDVSLIDKIIVETGIGRDARTREESRKQIAMLIEDAAGGHLPTASDLQSMIRTRIDQIDGLLSDILNEIMHTQEFQRLEASWRGLRYLVDQTETGPLLKLRVLNVSKADLARDLERAMEFDQSSLFKKVYEEEFGTFGGEPYAALVGDYEFGPEAQDVSLLGHLSGIAAAAHAPFLAAASPQLFTLDSFTELGRPRDLAKVFDTVEHVTWRSFRETEDARYVGLAVPHIMMRPPYGPDTVPLEAFNFGENADRHNHFVWGNAAYAFATRLTAAFAKYAWPVAIRGTEGGGSVEGLPVYTFKTDDGDVALKSPTEIAITDRREMELSRLGFIPLIHRKGTGSAVFFGASSCQKPKVYEDAEATAVSDLSARLPYTFAISRFAHYLRALARDRIGSFQSREDCERFLSSWIMQYVTAADSPTVEEKARRPLSSARIEVREAPARPGVSQAVLELTPHFQLEPPPAPLRTVVDLALFVK